MSPQAPPARTFPKLQQIHVASPCPADWEQMDGDDRSRFCHQCQRHVYQLSAMTTEEAERLIVEKEGQLCVKFYRRADGTVLTADCPVGVARVIQAARRGAYWIAGAGAALLVLVGLWPAKAESNEIDVQSWLPSRAGPSTVIRQWAARERPRPVSIMGRMR